MKKFSVKYKTIKWLALTALAAALLPLLLLGRYAVPAADDFSYGAPAHLAYSESGSVLSAAAAALDKTLESYCSWQGTFSAIFLMAVQPAVFSEALYALTPLIMIAALLVGSFLFCHAFFGELMGLDRDICGIIAAVTCLLCSQLLPSPVQGLYWFNGAVYYVFFHGLLLAACALGLRLVNKGGVLRGLGLCLLGFVIGGGNYVTALSGVILSFAAIGLLIVLKDGRWKRLIVPALVLLSAFAVSIAAPGNAVRQAAQEESLGAAAAVLMSFRCGISYGLSWLGLPVLGAMVLLGLLMWSAVKESRFSFRFPALVSLFSYCLFSAMFCPPVYAMGNVGDKRLLNIIYFAFLLLLALNLCYWLGWLSKRTRASQAGAGRLALLPLAAAVLVFGGGCVAAMAAGTGFSSVAAVISMTSGEAQAYHACARQRFEILNDGSVKDARLARFPCEPYLLFFDDITEDPTDWRNVDMSSYYGKDSVVLD